MLAQLWGNNDAAWEKVSGLLANTTAPNRSSLVFQGVGNGEYFRLGHVRSSMPATSGPRTARP